MNLDNLIEGKALVDKREQFNKIFFFRICGTGMGACACILKEAGFEVSGADVSFSPPMSTYLDTTGIECFDISKVDAEFLKQFDLIVVGNSVPRMSEQARMIEECGVPFTSFPSILGAYVLKDREVIGLAGTHGKTTTTYFLTQILEVIGEKPGYFVGGIIENRPPSLLGEGKYFAIESDEYDSAYFQKYAKFQQYELNHMILTSLEFDHADIYKNVGEIEAQFEKVIPKLSTIIANDNYSSIHKLNKKFNEIFQLYGEESSVGPYKLQESSSGSKFCLKWNNEEMEFSTNVIGKHNILNISACIILLLKQGHSINELQQAVESLAMVKRRQEIRGTYHGSIVIDDFAHHPRAIELTIDAIKKRFPDKEIITIFEPVSATARSDFFQDDFAKSFLQSDKVIIAQSSIKTTVRERSNLDCEKLIQDIRKEGIDSYSTSDLSDLRLKIDEWANDKNVCLILSNRTCIGLWESEFVNELH